MTENTPLVLKSLIKYVIIILVGSLFGMPYIFVLMKLFPDPNHILYVQLHSIPTYLSYFIKIATTVLLLIDGYKHKIRFKYLIALTGFFIPMLGVIVYALLFLNN